MTKIKEPVKLAPKPPKPKSIVCISCGNGIAVTTEGECGPCDDSSTCKTA